MPGFVEVLEPVNAYDIRRLRHCNESVSGGLSSVGLSFDDGKDAMIIAVAAAVLLGGHVDFADQNRLARQCVECFEMASQVSAIIPVCVEVAGDGVHPA